MTSELVKVERIKRKAQNERLMFEAGREVLNVAKDILVAAFNNEGSAYVLTLGGIGLARRAHIVSDVQAGVVAGVLTVAFGFRGYGNS